MLDPRIYVLLAALAIFFGGVAWSRLRHVFSVYEWERGLLYRWGKFVGELESGKHVRFGAGFTLEKLDLRRQTQLVSNQEILTLDGLALRVSASFTYTIVDPKLALEGTQSYFTDAYSAVHLGLRDAVTGKTSEELLAQRREIGALVADRCSSAFTQIGLSLLQVEVRDITFPGELKKMYAAVQLAQKEALASLERARGETASLRALANAAKLLENNPALLQLRAIQAVSESKSGTIVLNTTDKPLPPAPEA